VFVCPRGYLWNNMRDLYEIFYACCLWPWLGPLPARWWNPKGRAVWGVFFPTDNASYGIAFGPQIRWTDRNAVWDDQWAWSEEQCVTCDDPWRNFGEICARFCYEGLISLKFTYLPYNRTEFNFQLLNGLIWTNCLGITRKLKYKRNGKNWRLMGKITETLVP